MILIEEKASYNFYLGISSYLIIRYLFVVSFNVNLNVKNRCIYEQEGYPRSKDADEK